MKATFTCCRTSQRFEDSRNLLIGDDRTAVIAPGKTFRKLTDNKLDGQLLVTADQPRVVGDEEVLFVFPGRGARPVVSAGQQLRPIDDREFVVHVVWGGNRRGSALPAGIADWGLRIG